MKILIVKRDKIGDLLLTTPLIAHLARALPGAQVHVLANDYNASVVAGNPDVARVWVYQRTRHAGRVRVTAALGQTRQLFALRREGFDVAIAAGGEESPRAIARALAVGAARTIAFVADPARFRRLSDPVSPPDGGHEVERMLALASPLGIALPARSPDPIFRVPEAWRDSARAWLAGAGLAPGSYVVIGLSARDAQRQPASAQVRRWAQRLHRDYGLATVLHFAPGDARNAAYPGSEQVAAEILADAPPYVRAMPEGIPSAIGLFDLARTNVVPDSGLMHFAALSPGGVIGLFAGSQALSSPARWGPRGPRAVALEVADSVTRLDDAELFAALEPRLVDPTDRAP